VLELLPDPKDNSTKSIRRYLGPTYMQADLPTMPAALQPPHIDRRIAAQLSGFTIHGRCEGLEQLVPDSPNRRLKMIRISGPKVIKDMRQHLDVAGDWR